MPRETVAVDSVVFVISPDDPAPAGLCPSLLAGVRVLDELTGQPPRGPIAVTPGLAHSFARVAEGGLVGLTGIPLRAFPKLATAAGSAGFLVDAEGFVPRAVSIPLPADATFPTSFTPPPVNDLALHRLPTVVRGRVVQVVAGQSVAVAGALITVTGIWRTPPPAHLHVSPDAPNLVSLAPALSFDRAAGVGQLSAVPLAPVLGDDKDALDAVPAGAATVQLSNSQNLIVGDILLLDPDDPYRAEYLPIQAITPGSTADQPALFTFTYPTALPHRPGTLARKVTPKAAGPAKAFAADGWVGDTCVFLGDVAGLSASQQVRISGGAAPDEYRAASTLTAMSGPEGYYRLPPLSRVAQLHVVATQGALKSATMCFQPDYAVREDVLDLLVA
jgi:hypothetical protein